MRALRWILPVAAAALVAFLQVQCYPLLMARATSFTRAWTPPEPAPTAVQVRGDRLRVLGAESPAFVNVPAIGWNLPVLVCLWGWVVARRWLWLVAGSILLVLAHVLIADLAIRRSVGGLVDFPNELYRAWYVWIAALLPIVFVALGRYLGAPPASEPAA